MFRRVHDWICVVNWPIPRDLAEISPKNGISGLRWEVVTCSGEGGKSGSVPGNILDVPGRADCLASLRDDATMMPSATPPARASPASSKSLLSCSTGVMNRPKKNGNSRRVSLFVQSPQIVLYIMCIYYVE